VEVPETIVRKMLQKKLEYKPCKLQMVQHITEADRQSYLEIRTLMCMRIEEKIII
jgi:hypothetical protein